MSVGTSFREEALVGPQEKAPVPRLSEAKSRVNNRTHYPRFSRRRKGGRSRSNRRRPFPPVPFTTLIERLRIEPAAHCRSVSATARVHCTGSSVSRCGSRPVGVPALAGKDTPPQGGTPARANRTQKRKSHCTNAIVKKFHEGSAQRRRFTSPTHRVGGGSNSDDTTHTNQVMYRGAAATKNYEWATSGVDSARKKRGGTLSGTLPR